ncbi:MAG: LysE family translocator, partial [Solirubrobacterales bacterium]
MPSPETLYVFAVASAGLVLLPGPAIIYIATRGIVHGRRGGLTSMLGVEFGNVLQVLAATAGLAAVVASSAAAFSIVKYAGAAYLLFL